MYKCRWVNNDMLVLSCIHCANVCLCASTAVYVLGIQAVLVPSNGLCFPYEQGHPLSHLWLNLKTGRPTPTSS